MYEIHFNIYLLYLPWNIMSSWMMHRGNYIFIIYIVSVILHILWAEYQNSAVFPALLPPIFALTTYFCHSSLQFYCLTQAKVPNSSSPRSLLAFPYHPVCRVLILNISIQFSLSKFAALVSPAIRIIIFNTTAR